MAANYWESTQRRHWQFTQASLNDIRQKLEDEDPSLVQHYPLPERRLLSIFYNQQLAKLGKRMNMRQQALATAQVYVRRFYTKVEVRRTNPYLVLATALYLACKMEECPQHIRAITSEARAIWQDFIHSEVSKIGECEFYLISEMNSQLIVHHPYRTLLQLQEPLQLASDEVSLAWSIINDHYLTDLPLVCPPHVIAITAIFLGLALKPTPNGPQVLPNTATVLSNASVHARDRLNQGPTSTPPSKVQNLVNWLAEGEVNIDQVAECSQEIISLYDVWEQYNEKICKEQIARFVKARGLDK